MTEKAKSEKQTIKLSIEKIKELTYTKSGAISDDGKKSFPKCIWWDTELKGFGVRIFPSGSKSYIYKYRNEEGTPQLITVGDAKSLALKEARDKAVKMSSRVIDGADLVKERHAARNGKKMSELCEQFVKDHTIAGGHSQKRLEEVERRIKLQILPALGNKQVQHITASDIRDLRFRIGITQKHEVLANCVRRQLSTMFDRAKDWGYVEESFVNPAKGIEDFKEKERDLYVFPDHMSILARAIENEPNKSAKLAIWMFLLTGKRKMEILSAKWDNLDESARCLFIPLTKNGEVEQLPLNDEAWAIIERAKLIRVDDHPYIFPGLNPGEHLVNITKPWYRIRSEAINNGATSLKRETKLHDGTVRTEYVVVHSLRHTAAVWLVNHGDIDTALVGKILNHKSSVATKRYAKFKIRTKERALQDLGTMMTAAVNTESGNVVKFASRA